MLFLTNKAKEFIEETMNDIGFDELSIRIKIIGGGCAGLSIDFSFDSLVHSNDLTFVDKGVNIIVDEFSNHFLEDSIIDLNTSLMGNSLIIKNKNLLTCGCGKSVTLGDFE